jgi:hypothetical protein
MKKTDSVPAMLTPKEAILNRNAAELLGRDAIKRLNAHGNMLAKRGVDLASDPTPGPSTENLLGYQMGTMSVGDDRGDLLRDADSTFYGGGNVPAPTPTPTPATRMYQYGTDDVRRRDRYYRGININARPNPNAINSTPQGQIIQGSGGGAGYGVGARGGGGFGPGQGLLSPDQNPAYQAAISKGRPNRSGYTMIRTPSGGSMSVPVGQERKYTDLLFKGNPTADTGFQRPNPQAAYALGNTGSVPMGNTPYERSYRMGYDGSGPIQQPKTSFGFQVGNALRSVAPGILPLAQNAASRIANVFRGGFQPSEANQATNFGTPGNFGLAPNISAPAGINDLVQPPPLVGPSPNEQMFPTGAGGSTFFPSAQPGLGTVQMANEQSPGNMPLAQDTQYPNPVQPDQYPPQYAQQYQYGTSNVMPRRYSDYY